MNTPHRIIILGGGYAGIMCALRLAGQLKTNEAEITLINASDTFSERIRMHQIVAGTYPRHYPIARLIGNRPINFVQGTVTAIHPEQSTVEVMHGDKQQQFTYDTLVYALGSLFDRTRVPGVESYAHVLDDPLHLRELMANLPNLADKWRQLLIIGGGLTGIELATEIAESYPDLHVQLVTTGELASELSAQARDYIRDVMASMKITVYEGATVTSLSADAAHLADGSSIPFDVSVWAGAFTVPSLARESAIHVDTNGRVLTDATLRSLSHPNIYAVGDAAVIEGRPLRMACATAMPMGVHAARSIISMLRGEPAHDIRFRYLQQSMSLGRHDGLVQPVDAYDNPRGKIMTGRKAAWVKELTMRYTIWSIRLERWIPGSFIFPKLPKQTTQAPVTQVTEHHS